MDLLIQTEYKILILNYEISSMEGFKQHERSETQNIKPHQQCQLSRLYYCMEGATAITSSKCTTLHLLLWLPYCLIIEINVPLQSPKYFVIRQ